jgi:DNA polymerase elongation subunit (family B)
MKIEFYPLEVDYENREKSTIKLLGRTKDGKKLELIDDSIQPYFWVTAKKDIEELKKKIEKTKGVVKAEIENKKFYEEPIKAIKVTVKNQKDIADAGHEIRHYKNTNTTYETDINFTRRYLIDKDIIPLQLYEVETEGEKIKKITPQEGAYDEPKILAFDIETYFEPGRYSVDVRDPIISIAIYGEKLRKVITWKKIQTDENITFVANEAELIKEFIKTVKEQDADYLVGYFSDGFDLPYIRTRADKNKVDIDNEVKGLDINKRRSTKAETSIIHLDVFKFISTIMGYTLKTENFDLNSVAKELIGEGKAEIDITKMGLVWDSGSKEIEDMCMYNLKDAEITYKLCKRVLTNMNELTKVIGQPIFDISRLSYGQLVEWYLIRKAKQYNEICPNKPPRETIVTRMMQEKYKGAFVYDPKPGLYENLALVDFKGMYPSIIISYNISPTTISQEKGGYETPEIDHNGKKVKYYFTKKEGFITKSIKEVIIKRNELKKELRDKYDKALEGRSYALKTVSNAAYGYMGFFGARWHSRECAESITAIARHYIQQTIEQAQKEFEVIYGDTDSIVLELKNKNKKDVLEFIKKVNDKLPGMMELELDNMFPRGIFVGKKSESQTGAKKKYVLMNEKGELIVKGFETIRRDWSRLAKDVQRKVFEMVLKENAKEKAVEYVKKIIKDLRAKKFDIQDMIIKTQLQKNLGDYQSRGPHVAVAERMRERGMHVGIGTTIMYVVTPGKGNIRDRAKSPQEAQEYDSEYYINNQIIPAVGPVLEVLGYKKEYLAEFANQRKLGDY